jgi:hypothetical protein
MIRGRPQGAAATTEQLRDAMQDRQQTDVRELKRPTAEGGQPAEPVRRAVPEATRRPMPGREEQRAMHAQPAHDANPMQQQQQPQQPRQPMQQEGPMHHVFAQQHAEDYRRRWLEIQSGFVDDPRTAVQTADQLVAEMIQRMVDVFAHEKRNLEGQWSQGDSVSTEDLRVALQRYRGFFERLLADR